MLPVDVEPLPWSTWSQCPRSCWRNGEQKPQRSRTKYIKGTRKIYNIEFKECGDPCGFGK